MKSPRRETTSRGHQAHTQSARESGLAGTMQRPIKVTMLGAGSGFTPRLVNDLFLTPGNRGGEIALVDIDTARLQAMQRVVKKLMAKHGAKGWKVTASPDRRTVLKGSDYIVSCIEVSGLACVRHDNDIPARSAMDPQCSVTIPVKEL